MKRMIRRFVCLAVAAGGSFAASAAVAPISHHADWGYMIGGLGADGNETAVVFTNWNASISWTLSDEVESVQLLVVAGGGLPSVLGCQQGGRLHGGGQPARRRPANRRRVAHAGVGEEPVDGVLWREDHQAPRDGEPDVGRHHGSKRPGRPALRNLQHTQRTVSPEARPGREPGSPEGTAARGVRRRGLHHVAEVHAVCDGTLTPTLSQGERE